MELFFWDLLITAVAYLLVPTIFCINKKQLTESQIKKIVIINGICVWLIFTAIRIELEVDGTSAAVFLWSAIAYWLMKKKCLNKSDANKSVSGKINITNNKKIISNFREEKPQNFPGGFQVCGEDIVLSSEKDEQKQPIASTPTVLNNMQQRNMLVKMKKPVALIVAISVLSVLLAVSLTYNIIQFFSVQKSKDELVALSNKLREYAPDYYVNDSEIVHVTDYFYGYDSNNNLKKYEYDEETGKYLDSFGNEYKQ